MPSRCRPRPPLRKTVHRLISVGCGHADVAIFAVRSRPGISKKLTTEEENEESALIIVVVVEAEVIHYLPLGKRRAIIVPTLPLE
jgi:hypothetical protein